MPEMKTRQAVAKRFSINSNGTIKHAKMNKNHKLDKKSRARKRNLRRTGYVSKQETRTVKTMLVK